MLMLSVACPGEYEICSGDGPLPMAIFELLEYIVNEVGVKFVAVCTSLNNYSHHRHADE